MSETANLYSRQSSLNLISYDYAVVVGLGGVGNWIALDLALSGQVSNLILIDPDTIEDHNLNRTIFRYCDIGSYKVDATLDIILERRADCKITVYKELTNEELLNRISKKIIFDRSVYDHHSLIMDCRDDIYDDLLDFNCKLYKVGYDGTSMTINGNPRLQKVFTQRGGGYHVIPSFIGSSQMVANLAVCDALGAGYVDSEYHEIQDIDVAENPFIRQVATPNGRDELGRLNTIVRLDCSDIFTKCSDGEIGPYDKNQVTQILNQQLESEKEQ